MKLFFEQSKMKYNKHKTSNPHSTRCGKGVTKIHSVSETYKKHIR